MLAQRMNNYKDNYDIKDDFISLQFTTSSASLWNIFTESAMLLLRCVCSKNLNKYLHSPLVVVVFIYLFFNPIRILPLTLRLLLTLPIVGAFKVAKLFFERLTGAGGMSLW